MMLSNKNYTLSTKYTYNETIKNTSEQNKIKRLINLYFHLR